MRFPLLIAATLLASACGSVEYKDTNAAVDANPACVGAESRPGEAVAPWCKRELGAELKTERKSEKIDFKKKDGDG
ncbi:hypothetical protein FCE95_08660 [Luteimonas gilva]|uniref:Entry exclusion lipoprotein TrbK n=1 Tax=Luteimonas gilva TaxID=2572684 RepID=A0A4V5ZQ63_9GAMM|nr:hypothetical protein [Luteimonas gilva]TKR30203.1 hypothetical protein FCE95_08660 [Luteimonas gilva]